MSSDRRPLTILNCDIVNSTFYADRMDPEDFESLLAIFYETCKTVVEDHRGTFAHHTGDGFTAYFGHPRTLGRDAQEAITCGRALIEALDRCAFPGGAKVQVRIGIATGLVVVSTVNRQNNASESFAVGAPLHLAARIQSLSPPGRVSVDDTSYRLAERNFAFTDFGEHMLKGFAEPAHVWQVVMPRPVAFRFDERQERLSPFVGRNREMETLDRCRLLAAQGRGQTVLITGEAGIGKSRLVFESIERMAPARAPLVFQCLEDLQNEPLHPWINYARHAAKMIPSEPLEARRRKAGDFLDRTFPALGRLRPFVLSLVAQDSDELHLGDDDTPAHKLDALRAAIVERILEPEGAGLKIVVVEDIHWIDPSSESLLISLIERAARAPVLMLVTGRKDRDFGAAGKHVTHLAIDRLNAVQAVSLASHMMQGTAIADSLLAQLIERSDGIPLYIEEMARTASETGGVQQAAAPAEAKPSEAKPSEAKSAEAKSAEARSAEAKSVEARSAEARQRGGVGLLPIPDALQGTLLARLDGLGDSRQLAQIASVVGREFALDLLAKLAGRPKDAVERDLSRLIDAGLVRLLKTSTENKFEFRHALIREAAYNSLLRRDAVELHAALARLYEAEYPEMRNARPELLAQHLMVSRPLDGGRLALAAGRESWPRKWGPASRP